MRTYLFRIFLFISLFTIPILAQEPELFPNNRVLAKVKDKTFSLLDVIKQMDMYAYQYDQSLLASTEARYKFYMESWRYFLDQLVNNELMIFEAEGKDVQISDGDVREEILSRFGPNVQETLHKLNLSLEEAKSLIYTDLLSQKIQGYYVHAKAIHSVTPERIREAYDQYVVKHPSHTEWKYQFVTIRASDEALGKAVAEKAYEMIHKKNLSLQETIDTLSQDKQEIKISLSREVSAADADISTQHRSILENLAVNTISAPCAQTSRGSSGKVFRLFHLTEKKNVEPRSFTEIHEELKNSLIRGLVSTGLEEYIAKLRKKYDISSENNTLLVPDEYLPFELR